MPADEAYWCTTERLQQLAIQNLYQLELALEEVQQEAAAEAASEEARAPERRAARSFSISAGKGAANSRRWPLTG